LVVGEIKTTNMRKSLKLKGKEIKKEEGRFNFELALPLIEGK